MLSPDPDERIKSYLKHVVALSFIDEPIPEAQNNSPYGGMQPFSVSGFIMSVEKQWVWVTAGHVLKDIRKRLESGRQIRSCKLIDNWTSSECCDEGVFFSFDLSNKYMIDIPGFDYGFIPLSPQPKSLLEANGILPLDEAKWKGELSQYNFLNFELVGFPAETSEKHVEPRAGNSTYIESSIRPVLAAIKWEPSPPSEFLKDDTCFFGELIDKDPDGNPNGTPLNDIGGMSGSPIFGVYKTVDNTYDYQLVAIQSSWVREKRLIIGCSSIVLGHLIGDILSE